MMVFSRGGLHAAGYSGPVVTPFTKAEPEKQTSALTKQISSDLLSFEMRHGLIDDSDEEYFEEEKLEEREMTMKKVF
jgi:hypothetical protein